MKTARDIEVEMRAAVAEDDYNKAGEIGLAAGFSLDLIKATIATIEAELGRVENAKKIYSEIQPAAEAEPKAELKVEDGIAEIRRRVNQQLAKEAAEAKAWAERAAKADATAREAQASADRERHRAAEPKKLPAIRRETLPANTPSWLRDMNERHAMIGNYGGKCVIIQWVPSIAFPGTMEMQHQSLAAFRERYLGRYIYDASGKRDPVAPIWLSHPDHRYYDGIVFEPDGPEIITGEDGRTFMNLWKRWGVEPKQGDWSLIRRHIYDVLAAGDSGFGDYIVRWCAYKFQNPGAPSEVALAVKGGKGTGKGAFGQVLLRIFGQHGLQIFSSQHLYGKHNKHLQDKLFLFSDEAFWAGDREAERTLKGMLTEKAILIEPKGVDGFPWPNRLSLFVAANEGWFIPASHDERRYAVNNVSEHVKQREDYFTPLFAQINGDGPAAMLYDLREMELGTWHPRNTVPQTKALIEQKVESLGGLDQWWVNLLNIGELPGAEEKNRRMVRSNRLFDNAKDHNPKNRYLTDTGLGIFLRKMGCEHHHSAKFRAWIFPPLSLARKRWIADVGGDWDWLSAAKDWNDKAFLLDGLMKSAKRGFGPR
jgi:hypothetical protein